MHYFQQFSEFLQDDDYLFEHTLIVCSNDDEVDIIVNFLNDNNILNIGCNNCVNISQIKFVHDWNFRKGCGLEIIVSTDNILPELKLNNVKKLIHFSLSSTWTKFTFRFSSLFNSFSNKISNEVSYLSLIFFY